jgi:hypothetical protein
VAQAVDVTWVQAVAALWLGSALVTAWLVGRPRVRPQPFQPTPRTIRMLERRDLGVNRDGLHWYAFLVRATGDRPGWYAERAIGWTEDVVVGTVRYGSEAEARKIFEALEAP